jgi:hypothetical protein
MTTLLILCRSVAAHVRRIPLEPVVWLLGLGAMAVLDPSATAEPSWCLFRRLGIDLCPGCGLGHSIAHLARGQVTASVQAHPLGIPAVAVLLGRSGRLLHDAWTRSSRSAASSFAAPSNPVSQSRNAHV